MIRPSASRVLLRPFFIGSQLSVDPYSTESPRALKIIARILSLEGSEVKAKLANVLEEFESRHDDIKSVFFDQFARIEHLIPTGRPLSKELKLLIGAYFTHEYSFECAALFNPSIVPHPDQSGVGAGNLRFVMSLRATGEGHLSSITFRSGIISADGSISLDTASPYVKEPKLVPFQHYEHELFKRKLGELGLFNQFNRHVMSLLAENFTFFELRAAIDLAKRSSSEYAAYNGRELLLLALSNYEVAFNSENDVSERIVFPLSPAQRNGIEDARFVLFRNGGSKTYCATYTAYDGHVTMPQMLETEDFVRFKISTLNGPMVQNKGMALFPRKVNGSYAMLSRQSGESIHLMYSDHPHFWYESKIILRPSEPWDLVQIGNCGSPIETKAGWLVLTHGVGPMRKYSIGAILLDLENPSRVIGRLKEPLISPAPDEREGYVPNVVYTCGALTHKDKLIVPYAVSDSATTFAVVNMPDLLSALTRK